MRLNTSHGEEYSIHYSIKFDLQQVGGFFHGTPVFSTNKTDRHDITEILFKVALNNITSNPNPPTIIYHDIAEILLRLALNTQSINQSINLTVIIEPIYLSPKTTEFNIVNTIKSTISCGSNGPFCSAILFRHFVIDSCTIFSNLIPAMYCLKQ